MGFYLVAHQTHAAAGSLQCSADAPSSSQRRSSSVPPRKSSAPSPTRAQARSQGSERLPLGGVQQRRGSPRLGGGVGGSPSRLSPAHKSIPASVHSFLFERTIPRLTCVIIGASHLFLHRTCAATKCIHLYFFIYFLLFPLYFYSFIC